jgi:hypothetical protein
MFNQMQPAKEVERLIKDRTEAFVRETGTGITGAALELGPIGGADQLQGKNGSKLRARRPQAEP